MMASGLAARNAANTPGSPILSGCRIGSFISWAASFTGGGATRRPRPAGRSGRVTTKQISCPASTSARSDGRAKTGVPMKLRRIGHPSSHPNWCRPEASPALFALEVLDRRDSLECCHHPGVMCPFPVDPAASRTLREPVMSIPDELGDLAADLRFRGRLQRMVASQAPVADLQRQPEPASHLVELLLVVIALDEQRAPRRQ